MSKRMDTACYRELGAELRKRREATGMTEAQLAHDLGWSVTRVSRSELGQVRLSVVDVVTYLAFCGVYGKFGAELHAMCREAEPMPDHWLRRHRNGLPESAVSLAYHEATASASTSYEPDFVPGLLQTEGYIRAMVAERLPDCDIDFAVSVRQDRQRILQRSSSPAHFTFMINETALRRRVGSPAIMHEQLLSLLLLGGLPHVVIRVVPASATFGGAFRLFEYADHPPLVYLDSLFCGLYLEDPEYVGDYRRLISTIADIAMDERQSLECLAAIASDHDREDANVHIVEEKQL